MAQPEVIDLSPGYVSGTTRFELKPSCPASRNGDGGKDVLCPKFRDCTLGQIAVAVRAKTIAEAIDVVNLGRELGEVPQCEAGKNYAFKDPDDCWNGSAYSDGRSYFRESRRLMDRKHR